MSHKFIRFEGDIFNVGDIICISYNEGRTLIEQKPDIETHYDGDRRDEIWALMRLSLRPEQAEQMLAGVEAQTL